LYNPRSICSIYPTYRGDEKGLFKQKRNHQPEPEADSPPPVNEQVEPLIRVSDLVKTYHTAAGDLDALKDIQIDVQPGEFVCIIGKSGAGKTTLVNMLTGVDHPTRGEIWVGETPVHQLNEEQLALWRGRNLGIVYQSFYLMPTLSLLDNVLLPNDFCNTYDSRQSPERAMELLRQVEIAEHAYKLPSAISGGQQQRVAIARALANDPPIIIADEPTGRLDSVTAETIFQIFLSLVQRGKTILMVTHDHSLTQRFPRILHLVDGQISGDLTTQEALPAPLSL
jgi:putative ABC transport system ATP-binding protein